QGTVNRNPTRPAKFLESRPFWSAPSSRSFWIFDWPSAFSKARKLESSEHTSDTVDDSHLRRPRVCLHGEISHRKAVFPVVASVLGLVVFSPLTGAGGKNASPGGETADLQKQVLGLLNARCVKCHGLDKPKARLNLTRFDSLARGSKSGPV